MQLYIPSVFIRLSAVVLFACFLPTSQASSDIQDTNGLICWNQGLVVVELFTSQGCSSCPPADELLTDLSKGHNALKAVNILPLAYHVDYWDYLGWPDNFADARYTERQKAYARSVSRTTIYTPQMIVQGTAHMVGHDRDKIFNSIRKFDRDWVQPIKRAQVGCGTEGPTDATIGAIRFLADRNRIELQGLNGVVGPSHDLILVNYIPTQLRVSIGAGENSGRDIVYSNVVAGIQRIRYSDIRRSQGDRIVLSGRELSLEECHNVAILIQNNRSLEIAAAHVVAGEGECVSN